MKLSTEVKNLASLVTYRQLYNDGKSDAYYIISQFAESVIENLNLYNFGIVDMSEAIRTEFGFNIPDYVIQTALKRIKCVSKNDHKYYVDKSQITTNDIKSKFETACNVNEGLVDALYTYVGKKKGMLDEKQKRTLIKDFCAFVLDESNGNSYSDVISAFIIESKNDVNLVKQIHTIKEGAVLFAGINFNSNVSQKSAWTKKLLYILNQKFYFI